ncbi:MAG: phosphoribosyltransferase family protein [Bacteroidales bacterium]|nr:phosphoribosyltransferase family protein [Bacteroidales bacterium]
MNLLSAIFRQECILCSSSLNRGENGICLKCLNSLPRTDFHLKKGSIAEQVFYGKAEIEKCACYCYFKKGSDYRELIHRLKYNNERNLAVVLGEQFSKELCLSNWFDGIEAIVPVPIHYIKRVKRGYNQSEWLAKGISNETGIKVETKLLYKKNYHSSQTKKEHFERFINTLNTFNVSSSIAERYTHVLLVDDVLTSGSTITACIDAIRIVSDMKISVLTLGFAE